MFQIKDGWIKRELNNENQQNKNDNKSSEQSGKGIEENNNKKNGNKKTSQNSSSKEKKSEHQDKHTPNIKETQSEQQESPLIKKLKDKRESHQLAYLRKNIKIGIDEIDEETKRLRNKIAILIEKLSEDLSNKHKFGDEYFNIDELIKRPIEKLHLKNYKYDLQKEKLVFAIDCSGSCNTFNQIFTQIISVASKYEFIELYAFNNSLVSYEIKKDSSFQRMKSTQTFLEYFKNRHIIYFSDYDGYNYLNEYRNKNKHKFNTTNSNKLNNENKVYYINVSTISPAVGFYGRRFNQSSPLQEYGDYNNNMKIRNNLDYALFEYSNRLYDYNNGFISDNHNLGYDKDKLYSLVVKRYCSSIKINKWAQYIKNELIKRYKLDTNNINKFLMITSTKENHVNWIASNISYFLYNNAKIVSDYINFGFQHFDCINIYTDIDKIIKKIKIY